MNATLAVILRVVFQEGQFAIIYNFCHKAICWVKIIFAENLLTRMNSVYFSLSSMKLMEWNHVSEFPQFRKIIKHIRL